jgi:predicted ATPase
MLASVLKNLQIKNFKGWKDTGKIQMSPITLFFGTNSSGKSSIGQFLMMLKQTVESPDRRAVFFPGNDKSAVEVGTYQEMVFHRDPKNTISFEYDWSFTPPLKFKDPTLEVAKSYESASLSFKANIKVDDQTQHSLILNSFTYRMDNELSISMQRTDEKKQEYKIEVTGYNLIRKVQRAWALKTPYKFYAFPQEVVAYYQNADFVQELNLQHEKLFRSLFYLGPMRTKADRLYSWAGDEPESVGYRGENTIAAILAAKNRKIGLGRKKPTKSFELVIAQKLKQLGLIDAFSVAQIAENRQEYDVKVKSRGSNDFVDLPDVGFGVSQVLPVLVQCFYAPENSIIIMEQPEIHLHPSAQAALADVLIDVVNSKEDGRNRNIQLIIETHSEHFLRRLQRRIAEDTVSSNQVSAYFANTISYPTRLEKLEIDLFGNIRNWPDNFFGDDVGDIAGQATAAIKRRISQTA